MGQFFSCTIGNVRPIPLKGVVAWAPPCCGIPMHREPDKAVGGQGVGVAHLLALVRGVTSLFSLTNDSFTL